ncbi:NAD(P)/FAD-dependent oxidoreductase [Melioribacter sp. OK-6-Me]|uniref:NAD(P)/FAD-dependent oxidoreductase n=1 Tax=unclassified Melioribacter TaxID=2627329 RepID=UPI003EDAE419
MDKKIIIVGAGFAGITAAKSLKNSDHEILIIDKNNHHLFQPLLYQVATSALSAADIAVPIREIVRDYKNTRVLLSEVVDINFDKQMVITKNDSYQYDYLILSPGSVNNYYGHKEWEHLAPGLKTIKDAIKIREGILRSFEKAETINDQRLRKRLTTFVIIGGGPTGVELAGAIAEIAFKTLSKNFRNFDPRISKIYLIEAADRLLPSFESNLSHKALLALKKLGVEVLLNTKVKNISQEGVLIDDRLIESENIIWSAGNKVNNLINKIEAEKDNYGRVFVKADCTLKNYSNVFIIGDAAHFNDRGTVLPAIAPVAIQQAKYVSEIIKKEIHPDKRRPFVYKDKGIMATIGKAKAVARIGKLKIDGFLAWVVWGAVHIAYLIHFRNKFRVITEWIWLYITNRHGVRLIINESSD